MRTITKDEVSMEIFNDIYEFAHALGRPDNSVFQGHTLQSQTQKSRKDKFYGTKTFSDADILLQSGYDEGCRAIIDCKVNVRGREQQPIMKADVVGHTPHVAHFIIGHPLNMIRSIRPRSEAKSLSIFYDRAEPCEVSSEEMIVAARLLLDAVKWLEDHHVRVAIYALWNTTLPSQKVFTSVCIKHERDMINVRKIAYPLVHSSFVRRHCFRWLETTPVLKDNEFRDFYGFPFANGRTLSECRNYLESKGIIPTKSAFVNSKTLRSMTDAKQVVELLAKQTQIINR